MAPSSNLERFPATEWSGALSVQELRLWCAPEVILVITDLSDEESVLFHAIRQARHSAAKVLIAHVLPGSRGASVAATGSHRGTSSAELAQQTLDRMARKLRWVGIGCEAVLLRGNAAEEILVLAKTRSVNRVLLTAWRDRSPLARTVAEEIAPWAGVPVCVVPGGTSPRFQNDRPSGRIALALSLRSDCETPLAFASRLAQHYQATLSVVHVFASGAETPAVYRTPAAVAARIPGGALREAGLLCPLEMIARTGDPTAELLKVEAELDPDFLLLGVPRSPNLDPPREASVAPGLVNQARCPLLLLGHRATQTRSLDVAPPLSVPA